MAKTTRQTSKLPDGTEHISIDRLQETRSNSTLNLDSTCNANIDNIKTVNATATIITAKSAHVEQDTVGSREVYGK
jgi:L-rhamnose isomerase